MKSPLISACCLLGLLLAASGAETLAIKSPDGRIEVGFSLQTLEGAAGCPVYTVSVEGRPVIVPSRLGLELKSGPLLSGFAVAGTKESAKDETWTPVWGERSQIRDHYRQSEIELRETKAPGRRLLLTFRVSNEGAAFAYAIPPQDGMDHIEITAERSEFRFAADHESWAVYSAQGAYTKVPLSQIKPGCERPLVVRVAPDLYAALAEAKLVDHARMKFAPVAGGFGVASKLDGAAVYDKTMTTPWRVVMVASSPGRLVENNFLIANLNDPCALVDTSWIKPGKVIREVTLTTTGGKACIDFAVQRGLQYIEFDAGWYGHEYDAKSDASAVNLDPKRSKGPLDLQEVINYGAERGIGVLLYVNHLAAEKQLDQILPLYRAWGVKGVKYGFVNVGPQKWTSWLHEAIRKAALHKLMVDVHDEYRPTGYSRTYPNLMTVEGVRGDEETPTAEQTTTFAFTRMLAGPADHTVCYYDGRVDKNWTHAYQLAKPVCLFSPWQFLFWYDKPERAAGNEPELEFFRHLPTAWDETRVLAGEIGSHLAIARRSGSHWYIGCMNAGEPRTLQVPLAFLPQGQPFAAQIFTHDPASSVKTKVRIQRYAVDAGTRLELAVGKSDGAALRIVPAAPGEKLPAYPR